MTNSARIPNRLIDEKSPYLLQHAENPVDWYPWGTEAFEKAKQEDKPVFLSIGYSTCHWCHVMAHESFEDKEIANILNKYFVSIKVDKEERPDIDNIYMAVCQAFTGNGGWPTSIFMTPEQKPFFAGTYFPKTSRYGMVGFEELLITIVERWKNNKSALEQSAEEIVGYIGQEIKPSERIEESLPDIAYDMFKRSFDVSYGGFGGAPKFPSPHNLLFLLNYYEISGEKSALDMVEKTLIQMYKGGIFDHIGFGFSRYSTDQYFLVPHFEKMLYDNALLILSYAEAFSVTGNPLYKDVAEKTAEYILRELTGPEGGFYCAQDADSDGVEGKYYVFDYHEIIRVLGEETSSAFCQYYGITKGGNFEGKNIPNLLENHSPDGRFDGYLAKLYNYRKSRTSLHLDDKILTAWNGLTIAAFAVLYRVLEDEKYLHAAQRANTFIEENLSDGDTLSVSYRSGARSGKGLMEDYAFYIFTLLNLYEAVLDRKYLDRAIGLCNKVIRDFEDKETGGFYMYGKENEQLIAKPKSAYDGAIPSGNSVMAYNLMKLAQLTKSSDFEKAAEKQMKFMTAFANEYPAGYSFFLLALSLYLHPGESIVIVLNNKDELEGIKKKLNRKAAVTVLEESTKEYPLLNNKTTFYVCNNRTCFPPVNDLQEVQE